MLDLFTVIHASLFLRLIYASVAQDTEVVVLPAWIPGNGSDEVPLSFEVFGNLIELNLRRNDGITARSFKVWRHNGNGTVAEMTELNRPDACHYLHTNNFSSAAVSFCQGVGLHGIIFLGNVTLEITPAGTFADGHVEKRSYGSPGEAHIVKRTIHVGPSIKYFADKNYDDRLAKIFRHGDSRGKLRRDSIRDKLTLELAVFFDEAGYKIFAPYLGRDDERVRDMLLAYVNAIQAIYHHPSLGIPIDISLVRLDIMVRQPSDLPHFYGERNSLLDSFCRYAESRNPMGDDHPEHWDMGLYVSGLDFYAVEDGRKNSGTMGLATVGTVCINKYSCVIAELGVTNNFGRPYPSAGFTSVYIAAHEIGHNLGMFHDSTRNSCPRDGYIMSPSRGVEGETIWSSCSREVAERLAREKPCLLDDSTLLENKEGLEHTRFHDLPGREWDAKRQCEFLLLDKDATVVTLSQICVALHCRTPHRSGYYIAGPALDGTHCAPGMECRGGECLARVSTSNVTESGVQDPLMNGGWSDWRNENCRSGCLQRSKGAFSRRRICTRASCQGFHYDVMLCKDDGLCKSKRKTAIEYASTKCAEFGRRVPELDGKGNGLQAYHETERPWMACAIFCRRKDLPSYYTPRLQLNDLGLDPYFPDGTWCHRASDGQDYFCRQHHCLPEDFRFDLPRLKSRGSEDLLETRAQNARPIEREISDDFVKYFSLGLDGLPLLTSLPPRSNVSINDNANDTEWKRDDEWADDDYIDLQNFH